MTDTPDNTLPAPDVPDNALPGATPVPPVVAVGLEPWAQWRNDTDKGGRAAHDDASREPEDRMPPEDVAAEGYAFWSGYSDHWAELRAAGVIA